MVISIRELTETSVTTANRRKRKKKKEAVTSLCSKSPNSHPPSLLEAEAAGEEFWLYCESLRQLTRIFAYAQLSTDAVTVECLGQMELMIGKVNLRNWGKSIF